MSSPPWNAIRTTCANAKLQTHGGLYQRPPGFQNGFKLRLVSAVASELPPTQIL